MKLRSKLFYIYLIFLVIYTGFTLLPTPDPAILALYSLSALELRLLDITIIALLAGIWFAGFYGYTKLHDYGYAIRKDKDGKHINKITTGVLFLVLWLPVSSTVSAILNYIAMKHVGLLSAVKILENYINLILPLVGFIFIGIGARGLSELVRRRPTYIATHLIAIVFVYIGLVYYRLVATTYHRADVYHMSIWLILTTIVAPYIYMWLIGMLATYEIYSYWRSVAGIVYRRSWNLLALGLGWLVVMSIAFQYLTTLSARLNALPLYWLLAIVYSLLLVLAISFVLIALGARKLQRIEEV